MNPGAYARNRGPAIGKGVQGRHSASRPPPRAEESLPMPCRGVEVSLASQFVLRHALHTFLLIFGQRQEAEAHLENINDKRMKCLSEHPETTAIAHGNFENQAIRTTNTLGIIEGVSSLVKGDRIPVSLSVSASFLHSL